MTTNMKKNFRSKQLSRARRCIMSLAIAAPLAVSPAGLVTIVGGSIITTQAHAFGLGDIGGAIKKVGGAVKSVAKDAKNGAIIVGGRAKKIGKGAAANARDFGGALKRDAKKIGGRTKNYGKAAVAIGKAGLGKINSGVNLIKQGYKFVPPAIPTPGSRPGIIYKPGKNPFVPGKVIWDGPVPGTNPPAAGKNKAIPRGQNKVRRPAGKMNLGVVRDKSFKRPIGITKKNLGLNRNRKPIGRDKSVFGRPVYGKKRRKVQGIRLRDIRKSHKRSHRRVIGRDKSVFGRPVYGKSRKAQPKRSNRSRFGNKMLRPNSQNRNRRNINRRFNQTRNFDRSRSQSRRANFQRRNGSAARRSGGNRGFNRRR